MSDNEKIWMEHPNLGPDRKEQTTRKQLRSAWRKAGWFETEAPEPVEEDLTVSILETDEEPAKKPAAKKSTAKK